MSSQRHLDRLRAPVVVTYGTNETPEFQRQNRDFAAAVKAAGKAVEAPRGAETTTTSRWPKRSAIPTGRTAARRWR